MKPLPMLLQTSLLDGAKVVAPVHKTERLRPTATAKMLPRFELHNRRYIGSKAKLISWIHSTIAEHCEGESFADIFAGTGIVALEASRNYKRIILNDFLYSNEAIYHAFFGTGQWSQEIVDELLATYNLLDSKVLPDNYFSLNFGSKYFSPSTAKLIGHIREDLEIRRKSLTEREYYIVLSSLLYSADKVANTVGHYDAYFKDRGDRADKTFQVAAIKPYHIKNTEIFREDANELAGRLKADITYIDPPYNSRQYSRFYHVLETLVKWDKPELFGAALKPAPENISDYCKVSAKQRFEELIQDLKSNYIVVSYNNTYEPKSSSSKNKIRHNDIVSILNTKGKTQVFEKSYRHFNTGKTNFKDHKEFLFICKTI